MTEKEKTHFIKHFINAQYIYNIKRKRIGIKKRVCHVCDKELKQEYIEVKLYDKYNRQDVKLSLCRDHGGEIRI